jgi:MinD-like ATPase involved in chromosome partitioning or flagellar assembly
MKIFSLGLDHLLVNSLKENGHNTIVQNELPLPDQTVDHILIFTSQFVEPTRLEEMADKYHGSHLLYQYLHKGVRGYQHIHAQCERLGIHFLSPRATAVTILDTLHSIQEEEIETVGNLVGVFGSGNGVGVTRVAATLAKAIAAKGENVILLGLDLYDPGWMHKPAISLDLWRPRITGKILQTTDFDQLIKVEGINYLPGSFDYLDAQDYQEDEIEYLLQMAKDRADIVVADFGSIPESAAWYIGMQLSNLRLFVTHPDHQYRVPRLMEVVQHLDLRPDHFLMVANQMTLDVAVTAKQLAKELEMNYFLEFPYYPPFKTLGLPLGKRDLVDVDVAATHVLTSLGKKVDAKKRRSSVI